MNVPKNAKSVPFDGTKQTGRDRAREKGNGTFVPSRFPSRFPLFLSRLVSHEWS